MITQLARVLLRALPLVLMATSASAAAEVTSVMIESPALGRPVQADVYLPPDFDTHDHYRLVVLLHGQSDSPSAFRRLGFYDKADALITGSEIVPLVMVAPSIDNSFGINSDAAATLTIEAQSVTISYPEGAYEDFLTIDLLDFMANTYGVGREPADRVYAGISMGGYAALRLGLARPDLTKRAAGHSPAIVDRGFSWLYPDDAAWQERSLPQLASRYQVHDQKFHIDCGEQDSWGFFPAAKALAATLNTRGADIEWHAGPGGHDAGYWLPRVEDYLRFYGGE